MTFVSYAQNFEDIRLWRAFRGRVEQGFYIDVGANDPGKNSITKAFYDRNWFGVNIEPRVKPYEALCASRSRDINLQVVVSDCEGELKFFDAGGGFSTLEPDVAAELVREGRQVVERIVPARTLNDICAQYANGEIHFLKVDVEGHEFAVLRGMDFEKWRPWILLIESPFNVVPPWQDWLCAARYHEVYSDGINRFYLAQEHIDLAGAFDMAPGFLDDFQLCYGHHFSYPVATLEAQLAYERNRADVAEARLAAQERGVGRFLRRIAGLPRKLFHNWGGH